MPTLQEYAQLSNDARNRADDFLFLDFTPGDIQKRVGGDGSSLQAGEVMKLYLAAKQTHDLSATVAITSCSLDCKSLQSSAGRDHCVVAAHAGFDTIASREAKGQRMLDGRQLSDHSIERVGLEAILSFSPSKVAKIKANSGVSAMAKLRVQAPPAICMTAAANDNVERIAA